MSKKGLNIYKRKDNRWEGRYKYGIKPNGSIRYRSIYGKSYSEVKRRIIELRSNYDTSSGNCCMTVNKLFDEWLDAEKIKVKESTYSNYFFKIKKHLSPAFGKIKFEDLSVTAVHAFIKNKLSEGLSEKYVSDMIVVLKSMAKYTSKIYNCVNPISNAEMPKQKKKESIIFTSAQQKTLKKELLYNINPTKLGIFLCLFTGIRIGELCALKWSDFDFDKSVLSIHKTCQRIQCIGSKATRIIITEPKSSTSIRLIPVPEFICDLLKAFKPSDDCYLLSGNNSVVEPRTMQYRFKSILKKADLPSINFHNIRHMFATNCIALGFDVKTLSEILGHNSVEVTLNRYVHSSIERKTACMKLLDQIA